MQPRDSEHRPATGIRFARKMGAIRETGGGAMASKSVDRQRFWDEKILSWESERYDGGARQGAWLESITGWASASVRYRLALAERILSASCDGKRLIEIGCGTGRLSESLIDAGAVSYTGYDISATAVDAARRRVEAVGLTPKIGFVVSSITDLPDLNGDIVFSLGLLDWLTEDEMDVLFSCSRSAEFLHSFSEKRSSPIQYLHRLYVHVSYGARTRGYVPRYFRSAVIEEALRRHNARPVFILRDRRLSFGVLATSLIQARNA